MLCRELIFVIRFIQDFQIDCVGRNVERFNFNLVVHKVIARL